jgi:hypothetical protein
MEGVPSPTKGVPHTPEVCEKIRQAKLKYWSDPKNRKRMSRQATIRQADPEFKKKLSIAAKLRCQRQRAAKAKAAA